MPFSADDLLGSPAPASEAPKPTPTPAPVRATQPVGAPTGLGTRSVKGKIGAAKPVGFTAEQLLQPQYSKAGLLKDKVKSDVKGMATAVPKAVGREALSLADLALGTVAQIPQVFTTAAGDVYGGLTQPTAKKALAKGSELGARYNPLGFLNSGATKLFEKATGQKVDPGVSAQVMGKVNDMLQRGELKVEDLTKGVIPAEAVDQVAQALIAAMPAMGVEKAVRASRSVLEGKVKVPSEEIKQHVSEIQAVEEKATPHTITHETNASQSMRDFSKELGLNPEVADAYRLGARTHDFGKSLNPEISKLVEAPRPLTAQERSIVAAHTDLGAAFVKDHAPAEMHTVSENMARYHHERWDGQGPHELKGTEIPPEARAMAVVDVFDALTGTDRPYRAPFSKFDALAKMKEEVGHYDPQYLEKFTNMMIRKNPDEFTPLQAQILKGAIPAKELGSADAKMLGTIATVGLGAAAGYQLYNERDRWAGAVGGAGAMLAGAFLPFKFGKEVVDSPTIKALRTGLSKDAARFVSAVNPDAHGPKAEAAGAVIAENLVKQQRKQLLNGRESEARREYWKKIPRDAQVRFIKAMDKGQTNFKEPEIKAMAEGYKQQLEDIYKEDQAKGIKYDPVDHYFPHLYDRSEELGLWLTKKYGHGWTKPGFAKERGVDLISEAEHAGFKLRDLTPEEIVQDRQHASDIAHMKIDTFRELEQYGLARKAGKGTEAEPGETRWAVPDGSAYYVDPLVQAPLHNAFESKGLWAGDSTINMAYRGAMYAKNKLIPIRLGSLFHPIHVLAGPSFADIAVTRTKLLAAGKMNPLRFAADATGKLFFTDAYSTPKFGSNVRRAFRGEIPESKMSTFDKQTVQWMTEGGFNPELSYEFKANNIKALKDSLGEFASRHGLGKLVAGGKIVPNTALAAMEALYTRPIFEEWIPNLKTAAFTKGAIAALQADPSLLADPLKRRVALRRISKMVDDRFGEMNYSTTLMNKMVKDVATAGFLSYGWQLGFIRSGVGAVPEMAKGIGGLAKGEKLREQIAKGKYDKSLYVAYYTMATMFYAGLMTTILTGSAPKDVMDYVYPRTGEKNPDGSDARVSTPFYTREPFMLKKHIEQEGLVGGLAGSVSSKLNPLGENLRAIATNRDYFNREISDPSLSHFSLQRIGQQLDYLWTEGQPTWMDASKRAPGAPGKATGLGVLGFMPAPRYATETATQGRIANMFRQQEGERVVPFKQAQKAKDKAVIKKLMLEGKDYDKQLGDFQDKYNMSNLQINRMMRGLQSDPSVYMFRRLSDDQQRELWKDMSPQERETYAPALHKRLRGELE